MPVLGHPRQGHHANLFPLALFLILPHCAQARAADFQDWTVDCDNVKGCTAFGFGSEVDARNGFIHVERAGGPGGRAKIRLILYGPSGKGTVSLRLTADGEPIAGVGSEREARIAQVGDFFETEISPQELQPFIAALRKGETLNLATVDGKSKAYISLHGAAAALLEMDEMQGRIGTTTALIKAGGKPPTAVPGAPPPLPVIVRAKVPRGLKGYPALALMLRERLAKEDKEHPDPDRQSCWDFSERYRLAVLVEPLDRSRTLVGLNCEVAACNNLSAFWIVTANNVATAVPVAFEQPGSNSTDNELVNAEFDRRTGALSFFYKGNAPGYYGDSGKYVWTGRSFALVEYAAYGRCGAPSDYWPVLWRAKVK
jgi:Protein of unknown function (DUF1176)